MGPGSVSFQFRPPARTKSDIWADGFLETEAIFFADLTIRSRILRFKKGLLTFSKFLLKLVNSYALDSLDWPEDAWKIKVPFEYVRHFLEWVQKAPGKSHPSLRVVMGGS